MILDKQSYAELRDRARMLDELQAEKRELETLLNTALHELGQATGAKDPQYFSRLWRRERNA